VAAGNLQSSVVGKAVHSQDSVQQASVMVLRRYEVLENTGGYAKEGVEEMVLWKSGDVRRCGVSGEMVAV